LEGTFHLVFDREGLFTVAGTIVMLPEQRILSLRKTGSVKEAEEIGDAVGETGNLLVGSWDRIFREELEGHLHFLQTGTFLGNPWTDSQKSLGLPGDEEFLFIPYEMTVGSFPAFTCGVIFPEAVLHPAPPVEEPAPAEAANVEVPLPAPAEAAAHETAAKETTRAVETCPVAVLNEAPTAGESISQTIQKMVQSPPVLPGESRAAFLKMYAKDMMQTQVLWGTPDDSVEQAMAKMQQADAACMLIGANGVPEGIVTWIDIAEAVSVYLRPAFARWRRPADDATLQIKLGVLMSRPVFTLSPDAPPAVVMETMCRHRLRCLPVVDVSGKVQGVVTVLDLFKALLGTGEA
jgi:CBS domain-containing protein